jgi:hypothetical protein
MVFHQAYGRRSWRPLRPLAREHATVVVCRDGTQAGDARHDAPKAGFALTTRIYESTSSKVATMVDQLLPPAE